MGITRSFSTVLLVALLASTSDAQQSDPIADASPARSRPVSSDPNSAPSGAGSKTAGPDLTPSGSDLTPSGPGQSPGRSAKSRRELLRDPSDLGIGLTINRDRGDRSLPARAGDQRAVRTDYGGSLYGLRYYGMTPYDAYGYRIGGYGNGRSPIYDWQAPVVQQHGNRWIIQPGYFRDSPPGALWHP